MLGSHKDWVWVKKMACPGVSIWTWKVRYHLTESASLKYLSKPTKNKASFNAVYLILKANVRIFSQNITKSCRYVIIAQVPRHQKGVVETQKGSYWMFSKRPFMGLRAESGEGTGMLGCMRMAPIVSYLGYLVASWWASLGRSRRCGLVRGGMSLGGGFEISKTHMILSLSLSLPPSLPPSLPSPISLPPVCRCELSAVPASSFVLPSWTWTLCKLS